MAKGLVPGCGNCKFSMVMQKGVVVCRRYPPEITEVDRDKGEVRSNWPLLAADQWCGEWALLRINRERR